MTEARLRRRRQRFATIPRELLRDAQVSTGARLLYALLDDFSNGADDAPWPSQETLAGHLGVTDRCVRNWLNELVRHGWLDVEKRAGRSSLHWLNERPTPRNAGSSPPRNESSAPPRNAGSDEGEPGEGEPGEGDPPNPPDEQGGDDGGDVLELFADGQDAPPRKPKPSNADQVRALNFEEWWQRYPSRAEPDGPPGQRGGRQPAERAWGRALKAGGRVATAATTAELHQALTNYLDARELAAETFGGWPPLVHGSTFLNERRLEWETPVTGPDDERLGRWRRVCETKARERAEATGSSWEVPMSGPMAGVTEDELNQLARDLSARRASA